MLAPLEKKMESRPRCHVRPAIQKGHNSHSCSAHTQCEQKHVREVYVRTCVRAGACVHNIPAVVTTVEHRRVVSVLYEHLLAGGGGDDQIVSLCACREQNVQNRTRIVRERARAHAFCACACVLLSSPDQSRDRRAGAWSRVRYCVGRSEGGGERARSNMIRTVYVHVVHASCTRSCRTNTRLCNRNRGDRHVEHRARTHSVITKRLTANSVCISTG